ncbi:hypothetical protein BDZ97DRAFT_1768877 [Flammula alnicola]|nr:hypothetical protein BDZ97DRAFT_1768877 [Flammula alnicola]
MQLKLAPITSLAVIITTAAGAALTANGRDTTIQLVKRTCTDPQDAIPLLRAYSQAATDHFYTTNAAEMKVALTEGYSLETQPGQIFPAQGPITVPLYRAYAPTAEDHFYTTSAAELDNAVIALGYNAEGITGYVYTEDECSAVPLYRLYNADITDHFYTQDANERDNAVQNLGYTFEGIAEYILPN